LESLILIIWCGVHKTNVVGTLNMLGLAKRVGARFLLTSTSEVYGDPLQHPQAETYWGNVNPIGNTNVYFISPFQLLIALVCVCIDGLFGRISLTAKLRRVTVYFFVKFRRLTPSLNYDFNPLVYRCKKLLR
jgi:hypothetical protein